MTPGPTARPTARLGKLLAWVLRHEPQAIGLELDSAGWAEVEALRSGLAGYGRATTRDELERCVAADNKGRYRFSADGLRIRANQGHSIDVELGLEPADPPARLFHGTPERFVNAILAEGLVRGQRHAVHLSTTLDTAVEVGRRRGRAVIFTVDCASMRADGLEFFCSDNGVWLTAAVPPRYLSLARSDDSGQ